MNTVWYHANWKHVPLRPYFLYPCCLYIFFEETSVLLHSSEFFVSSSFSLRFRCAKCSPLSSFSPTPLKQRQCLWRPLKCCFIQIENKYNQLSTNLLLRFGSCSFPPGLSALFPYSLSVLTEIPVPSTLSNSWQMLTWCSWISNLHQYNLPSFALFIAVFLLSSYHCFIALFLFQWKTFIIYSNS